MAISTDSIIHYTNTYEKLKSILKEGFKLKYCAEVLYTKTEGKSSSAHPMISFCDIPLSHSDRHFGLYGHYGIGLSKTWAKLNRINPVLYIEKESYIGDCIIKAFKTIRNNTGENKESLQEMIVQTKCFTKNYSGPLKRGNIDTDNYRFYDEREWRFIPAKIDIDNKSRSIPLSKFNINKAQYNNDISDYRFKFMIEDISYIIVKEIDEIPEIIEFLRSAFYKGVTGRQLDILLSKVCSTQQIVQDY